MKKNTLKTICRWAGVGLLIGAMVTLALWSWNIHRSVQEAQYYVDTYQPDRVLMAYSRQMICNEEYDLIEGN